MRWLNCGACSGQVVSKVVQVESRAHKSAAEQVHALVADDSAGLTLSDVNALLQLLWNRKQVLEQREAESNLELLTHFLQHSRCV